MFHKNKLIFLFLLTSFLFIRSLSAQSLNLNEDINNKVQVILDKMTLEEKIGQMIIIDLRKYKTDISEIDNYLNEIMNQYFLGGFILFKDNIVELEQTVKFIQILKDYPISLKNDESIIIPPIISVDQEGGFISRIPFGTTMPGNMALGAINSEETTRNVSSIIGKELEALGINVDFAPVADINNNQNNPVIGIRSFSSDPQIVTNLVISYIKGLHDSDIAATAKHFPGHGNVETDSHLELPYLESNINQLEETEFIPFKNAIKNDVDMIMTAHIALPNVDNTKYISKKDGSSITIPATLSKKILTDILRNKMKFDGVIITDAIIMKGIADNFDEEQIAVLAVEAGNDILLMPKDIKKVFNTILDTAKINKQFENRINESVKRIIALKIKRSIINPKDSNLILDEKIENAKKIVGSEEHKKIEKETCNNCVTLINNSQNILPFKLNNNNKVTVFVPYPNDNIKTTQIRNSINNIIINKGLNINNIDLQIYSYNKWFFALSSNPSENEKDLYDKAKEEYNNAKENIKNIINNSDFSIIISSNSNNDQLTPGKSLIVDFMLDTINYLETNYKKYVMLASANPYDDVYYYDKYKTPLKSYLAVYMNGVGENIPAGLRVIFGEISPKAKLPVNIMDKDKQIIYNIGHGLNYTLK